MKTKLEVQLAKLVAMPTITDDAVANELGLDYIERQLTTCGLFVKRFNFDGHGSLMATTQPEAEKAKVLLYAHLDTAPGEERLFTLQREGDMLVGRGTYDMKFAIAAYLQLVEDLQDTLEDYDFAIMITTDEEYGGRDGISGSKRLLEQGYRFSVAIIPDGGNDWDIETLAKGRWRFNLVAEGRSAHGSRPWEGDSASFKLVHALHELKQHFADHGPNTDTLNIGMIQGGESFNQVPANMYAWVEIRLIDKASVAKNELLLDAICKRYDVRIETRVKDPPLIHDITHPLIQAFADSVERVGGIRPKGCMSYGGSDADHFMARSIPCIVTRPTGGGHHGPNEWVNSESLRQMVPILKDYLEQVAKTADVSVDSEAALV